MVIDNFNILVDEAKRNAPVAIDSNRPVAFKGSLKAMEKPSIDIYVVDGVSLIKNEQLEIELSSMARLNTSLGACVKELLKTFVLERFDQRLLFSASYSVCIRYTHVNGARWSNLH